MTAQTHMYLLQAYLNRELSPEAEAEFEIMLLSDPELAALAEADSALQLGLNASATHAPVAQASALSQASNTRAPARPRRGLPWHSYAQAAGLIGISATFGYLMQPKLEQLAAGEISYIDQQRGEARAVAATLPSSGVAIWMVPVASVDPCSANIRLTQGAKTLETTALPDNYSFASVVLRPNVFAAGEITVSVRCEGKEVGRYVVNARVR
jgi:anti-sigma factor RsiW